MFKKLVCAVLFLLWLSGCGESEADIEKVSEYYGGLKYLTLGGEVISNGGVQMTYEILFTRTDEGDKVEILSPESLAGISARIYPDKAEVQYDGMAVETLLPGISGYVPADAVSGAIKDLASSVPEEYCFTTVDGRDVIAVTFAAQAEGMTVRKTLFVDKGDMSLVGGEFYMDEMMVMELRVSSFVI